MKFFQAACSFLRPRDSHEAVLFKGKSSFRQLTVIENYRDRTRILYAGNRRFVSGIHLDTGFPLHSPYFVADFFVQNPTRLLFLGGGAHAAPGYVWRTYHPKEIVVVDRDPLTTKLAQKYFSMPRDPSYRVVEQDVTDFLSENNEKFDVIFSDLGITPARAKNPKDLASFCETPGIQAQRSHLAPGGVLVSAFIARLVGDDLLFARGYIHRFRTIFPKVYLFSYNKDIPSQIQLHIVVATHNTTALRVRFRKTLDSHRGSHGRDVYKRLWGLLHADNSGVL